MNKNEVKKLVKEAYDKVVIASDPIQVNIPDLDYVTMNCTSFRDSSPMIRLDLGPCWLTLQSGKYDRKTIIDIFTDVLWIMMD